MIKSAKVGQSTDLQRQCKAKQRTDLQRQSLAEHGGAWAKAQQGTD